MDAALDPNLERLCHDPSVCWAGSKQLPIPYLGVSGAADSAHACTLVSGSFFYMHFFAIVAYGVDLSAKSVAR